MFNQDYQFNGTERDLLPSNLLAKRLFITSFSLVCIGVVSANANASNGSETEIQKLLIECSQIKVSATRLECYDQVALNSESVFLVPQKKQIDLKETIRSTIAGKPKIIVDNPSQLNSSHLDSDMEGSLPNSSSSFETESDNMTKNVDDLNTLTTIETIRKVKDESGFELEGNYIKTNGENTSNLINDSVSNKDKKDHDTDKELVVKQDKESINSTNFDQQILLKQDSSSSTENVHNAEKAKIASSYSNIQINNSGQYSPLSLMYDLDKDSDIGLWKPRPHNPMYLIPLYMHDNPNRSPSTPNQEASVYTQNEYRSPELKFQISFKSKLAQDLFDTDADLWLGYTQQSHWQVYNEDNSRPFRAHDYMPELFITQPVKADLPFNGHLRMLGAGFMHHSNGEDDPLSRSWNKAYLMGGAEWGKLTIIPRYAFRIKGSTSSKPDDNPDIEDYYGYGDLRVFYDMDSGRSISGTFRINPSTGKGAAEIDYIYPMDNNVNLFLNLFHGYGESIVDYNHEDTAVGVGIMLNDWRGL